MKKGTLFTSIGGVVVLIISFIAFVLPSATMGGRGQQALEFGEYNGRKIKYEQGSDFTEYVSQISDYYRQQTSDLSRYNYAIFNQAFTETVKQYAYEDAVKKSGYSVPEEQVNRMIRSLPQFQENGKFSAKLYNKADKSVVEEYKNDIRNYLFRMRIADDVFGSTTEMFGVKRLYGLKMSDAEAAFLRDYGEELRGFDMVAFDKKAFPDDEKLKYAEANSAKFNKFDLSVITVDEKAIADTVVNRIKNNEITFEDAVAEYSNNNYSNTEGTLTNNLQYQVENILSNKADLSVIADLAVGSSTVAIETLNGVSIFKKNGENVAPDFTDSDMMAKVSAYIFAYESTVIEDYYTAKAKDFVTDAMTSDFDAACEKAGVEKITIAPFPLNYGGVPVANTIKSDNDVLKYADENETFLKTAFSLKMNELSEPFVLNSSICVIQYTNNEEVTFEEDDKDMARYQISYVDESSSETTVLKNPKLKNNFADTYFNKMYN